MRRGLTASQTAVYNIRARLRKDMVNLARTHRGCAMPRGCGCLVDRVLAILETSERQLFEQELSSYADPTTLRRIVEDDNSVTIAHVEDIARTE